nr:peptidase_M23 [uncultured Clostridium sp.]
MSLPGTATPVVASDSGVVYQTGWSYQGYGKYVIIDHGNGYMTLYGHNSALYVQEGEQVSKGQTIAAMGSTGNSSGNHCHFEVIVNGVKKNPALFLG